MGTLGWWVWIVDISSTHSAPSAFWTDSFLGLIELSQAIAVALLVDVERSIHHKTVPKKALPGSFWPRQEGSAHHVVKTRSRAIHGRWRSRHHICVLGNKVGATDGLHVALARPTDWLVSIQVASVPSSWNSTISCLSKSSSLKFDIWHMIYKLLIGTINQKQ